MVLSKNLYRIEKDSMGPVKVPKHAYYGAQKQRAIENFPISDWRFGRELIYALGLIKYAAAKTNFDLDLLGKKMAKGITYTPFKRAGTPLETASLIAYLATPGASYITGQIMVVDGGNCLQDHKGP